MMVISMHTRLPILVLLLAMLTACGNKGGQTLEQFKELWYSAVNSRQPEKLYALLDSKSRRSVDQALEMLRGLSEQEQLSVINYLGGDRVTSLHDLPNDRYFALWWRKATDDQIPTMTIEAAGEQSAYMVVARGELKQRYELKVEGGRWVWSLPEQKFEMKVEKK